VADIPLHQVNLSPIERFQFQLDVAGSLLIREITDNGDGLFNKQTGNQGSAESTCTPRDQNHCSTKSVLRKGKFQIFIPFDLLEIQVRSHSGDPPESNELLKLIENDIIACDMRALKQFHVAYARGTDQQAVTVP